MSVAVAQAEPPALALAGGRPAVNPWIIAITVTLATFMEVLDTSIANVALPHIAGNLSADLDQSTWVLTSYLVANAIVLPLSGWMSTLIGRKNYYMLCVTLFTCSSFMCGLAPNLGLLVFFRILQGLGGGGLQPSEQAILADTFPPAKRGMAFAFYGFAVVAAPAIGPTVGGFITDHYTWRWIFYINIPIGIISLLLTSQLIHDPPHMVRQRQQRKKSAFSMDYIGLGLIAVGLGLMQVVLDRGEREDWFDSHWITLAVIISITALVAAVFWELRHKDPIVDLRLLRERNFAVSNMLMFILGVVLLGSTVLIPELTQNLMGYTATLAGEVISPGGFAVMACMPFVAILLKKFDTRWLVTFGLAVSGWGLYRMSHFDLGVDYHTVMMARVVQAIGLAFLFVPINTVSYAYLPKEKNTNASGFINLARNIGGSVGIAVATTLIDRRTQTHQSILVQHATPYDWPYRQTLHAITLQLFRQGSSMVDAGVQAQAIIARQIARQAAMLAYLDVFRWMAFAFWLAIPVVFLLKKKKGGELAMH